MPTPTGNSPDQSPRGGDAAPHEPEAPPPRSAAFFARSMIGSRTYYFESTVRLFPGVTLPLRSMLVAANKRQILVSPVGTPEEASQVEAPLTLVAPSLSNHQHLAAVIERYRPLALWGPPGLAEGKAELGPMHVLGFDAWPYGDQLGFVVVEGAPQRNEVVLFHRASRTIYTPSLFCNICEPDGFLAPLVFRAMGIYRRFATPKIWQRWIIDGAAFSRSINEILHWDFDRIVVAHGDVVDRHAREQFGAALRERHLIE